MTWWSRVRAEAVAGWHAFVRRRTAVFFTFFFPVILVVIFGALVGTQAGGIFARAPAYYMPGYLAVVVLFTPLSRVSSTVARHREGRRFEKLATTPITPHEWLLAHSLVNTILVGLAALVVLIVGVVVTGAMNVFSLYLVPFIIGGTVVFCGFGALFGWLAESQDGAIAASNAIGLPVLFLSETFVPRGLLPAWFRPIIDLSPLTYFARGVRAAILGGSPTPSLLILFTIAIVAFLGGAAVLPWRS